LRLQHVGCDLKSGSKTGQLCHCSAVESDAIFAVSIYSGACEDESHPASSFFDGEYPRQMALDSPDQWNTFKKRWSAPGVAHAHILFLSSFSDQPKSSDASINAAFLFSLIFMSVFSDLRVATRQSKHSNLQNATSRVLGDRVFFFTLEDVDAEVEIFTTYGQWEATLIVSKVLLMFAYSDVSFPEVARPERLVNGLYCKHSYSLTGNEALIIDR